jgi:hypothetical protein
MDGFVLASGVGSLVVAGLCYSAYRNMKDVSIHLKVCVTWQIKFGLVYLTGILYECRMLSKRP